MKIRAQASTAETGPAIAVVPAAAPAGDKGSEGVEGDGGIDRTLPRQVLVLVRFNNWAGVKISPGAKSLCTRSRTVTASGQGGSGDGGGQEEVAGMEVQEQDEETGSGDPAEPDGDDTANGPPLPLPREVKETGSFNDWAGVPMKPEETGVYTRSRRAQASTAETGPAVVVVLAAAPAGDGGPEGVEGQGDEETDQAREEDKGSTDAQRVKKPRGLQKEVMESQQFAAWWGASGDLPPR
uniref:Uncharacterized protein n=1 Tax=Chromera velia CCMP2878 TaxID=1169474 RepID=A0A0G4HUD9_9ALVE|eukprot:Cvel_1375.t1-p1 / transcript=Cvel_1375.t1 / gene=Cvel_1375 / organism=Chromera_velia_CCMP2878 / gene_product=hypothetical protein / transcript_product=hypothetical protein / location=Cvel_scaffold47:134673-136564(+) / protein_length=238 / sequence_SO=supercontig / SO=protein_coding / is_pseudo=false